MRVTHVEVENNALASISLSTYLVQGAEARGFQSEQGMSMGSKLFLASVLFATSLGVMAPHAVAASSAQAMATGAYVDPLDDATLASLKALYKQLIDAENRHDLAAVRPLVWESPSALFVAKTKTPEEGNWAGFWGTDTVIDHLGELYQAGPFKIEPDYAREKVVGLTRDVAQTYVPVNITVAYAGQAPVPKPFLMILEWIRTPDGWRMATDVALPVPPAPNH
jgi:hypothetical protein